MKKAVILGEHQAGIAEVPDPQPQRGLGRCQSARCTHVHRIQGLCVRG